MTDKSAGICPGGMGILAGMGCLTLLLGCAVNNATLGEQGSRYSAADEAIYQARLKRLSAPPEAGAPAEGLAAYDPLEEVPGAAVVKRWPVAKTSEQTIRAAALAAAVAYAEANNSSAFIVWRKGRIESANYFAGTDRSTPLVSRSLAKPITVLAVGRAIHAGFIASLDQPVADFIVEWKNTPKDKILVRHLLDMRSGLLSQISDYPGALDILNRAYLHPRHGEVIVHDYPLTNEPGTRYDYSNANSELVSLVIERATGQRYGAWVSEQVLQPLGAAGGHIWVNRPGGLAHSGCCILLPAESWLQMAILLLQDGVWEGDRLLPNGYVREMLTPTPQNQHTGMGLYVAGEHAEWRGPSHPSIEIGRMYHSEPYLDSDLFLFDGNANQVVYVVPSEELIILRTGGRPPAEPVWDNSFLPNTLIRGIVR